MEKFCHNEVSPVVCTMVLLTVGVAESEGGVKGGISQNPYVVTRILNPTSLEFH